MSRMRLAPAARRTLLWVSLAALAAVARPSVAADAVIDSPLPSRTLTPPAGPDALVVAVSKAFNTQAGRNASFAFAVTRPGRIVVEARWQGSPVTVVLRQLATGMKIPVSPPGASSAKLDRAVTAEEVGRGVLWKVSLIGARASGAVSVRAPSPDRTLVEAEMTRRRELIRQQVSRTSQLAAITPYAGSLPFDASALSKLNSQLTDRFRLLTTSGNTPPRPAFRLDSIDRQSFGPLETILLTGAGFRDDTRVNFDLKVYGPQGFVPTTVTVPPTSVASTALLVAIPHITGFVRGPVSLSVTNAGVGRSNSLTATFVPLMASTFLPFQSEDVAKRAELDMCDKGVAGDARAEGGGVRDCFHGNDNWYDDNADMDGFNRNFGLRNGWTLKQVHFTPEVSEAGEAGASLNAGASPGTTFPSVSISWWTSPWDWVSYNLWVEITGPEGVPYL